MKPCNHNSRPVYKKIIDSIRRVAGDLGYAIAVHGSLIRDIDLVAIPWTRDAKDAKSVAEAIRAEADRIIGFAQPSEMNSRCSNPKYFRDGMPTYKAHGRLVWSFHLTPGFDGPYIDLSVMPREGDCIHDMTAQGSICVCSKCGYEFSDRPA